MKKNPQKLPEVSPVQKEVPPSHKLQLCKYVMFSTICYHLCNLKNVKNTHGGVLLLKVTLLHGCFSHFLNYANGTKSRKASHTFHQYQSAMLRTMSFPESILKFRD